jgi:hypothetical protein
VAAKTARHLRTTAFADNHKIGVMRSGRTIHFM